MIIFEGVSIVGGASPLMLNFRNTENGKYLGTNVEYFDAQTWDWTYAFLLGKEKFTPEYYFKEANRWVHK